MTEITQADRDMAAHVWMALDADQLDTASLQIFFARHRMEATEELRAENERLRETLMLCAKHVDWMPHPHCVEVEAAIRAALGETK